jgi:hypothetical protein
MTIHRWVEADGIGLMVAFDEEPTPEAIAVFEDLARHIAAHPETLRRAGLTPVVRLTEDEAAEPGDRQMARIVELRRKAGLDG